MGEALECPIYSGTEEKGALAGPRGYGFSWKYPHSPFFQMLEASSWVKRKDQDQLPPLFAMGSPDSLSYCCSTGISQLSK